MTKFPFTTKPEDIPVLLKKLQSQETPVEKIGVDFIKKLGFSTSSSNYLLEILRKLRFVDAQEEPSDTLKAYIFEKQKSGLILASAIKSTYQELFKGILCPYLEGDESLLEIFKREESKTTPKNMNLLLDTFRNISELADFQDILCTGEPAVETSSQAEKLAANVKVNPNLQLNIQIHIDPDTPDEKIEVIFKNMQKYILGKEAK